MQFKDFFEKNRETVQLVYGVVLIVLIPLLIAFNTVFIIKKYNQSIDVILQRNALSLARTISELMRGDLPWEYFMQQKIKSLMVNNREILELNVWGEEEGEFKLLASSNEEAIGTLSDSYFYKLAWLEDGNGGLATDSWRLAESGQSGELLDPGKNNERFWLVALPMWDASDNKQALLTIKLSSEIVDELTNYNRNISVYLLIGTMVIVILFLLVAVRLWDYVILYKKTKEVDRMKDEFISMASHELRSPVTGIRGYISMILDGELGPVSDKIVKPLGMVKGASERLMVLVEDLLDVGRIEQGRIQVRPEETEISAILKDVLSEFKLRADKKKLTTIFQPHKKPLPKINIDPDRFKQVMINLVGNAIKYTEAGSVEIITQERYQGKVLEIKIKDTGIGMSGKDRERLFEKFYRINSVKTKNITGTGLGLWITKQLVEIMKGIIIVQ